MLNKKGYLFVTILLSSFFVSFTFSSSQLETEIISNDLKPNTIGLSEAWSFATGGPIYTSPAFIDQNRDQELEIVFGSTDDYIYCVNNTGDEVWKYQTGGDVTASPAVADLNNDSYMDVLVISKDGFMYCLDINGSLIWKSWIDPSIGNDPIVVDLDLDGDYEILTSNSTNRLYVIDHEGQSLWNASHANYVGDPPVVCDYTGDTRLEIIVPGLLGPIYYDYTGTLLNTDVSRLSGNLIYDQEMVVADLNNSGVNSLLFYEDTDDLVCTTVTYAGGDIDEYWKIDDISKGTPISSPVIADVNGDTYPEILIHTSKPGMSIFGTQGILYCIRSNGDILWSNTGVQYGNS